MLLLIDRGIGFTLKAPDDLNQPDTFSPLTQVGLTGSMSQ